MPYPKQLEKFMLAHDVDASEVWEIQAKGRGTGKYAIYHSTLERVAAKAGVVFNSPTIIEQESEAFRVSMIVEAWMVPENGGDPQTTWSIGECSPSNYRVTGNQAGYPWAMAEKRGKDRCILKLLNAHGTLYSEDELVEQEPPERVALVTSEQAQNLVSKAEELGANWDKFLEYLGVKDIAELRADLYETAMQKLELKRKQNA